MKAISFSIMFFNIKFFYGWLDLGSNSSHFGKRGKALKIVQYVCKQEAKEMHFGQKRYFDQGLQPAFTIAHTQSFILIYYSEASLKARIVDGCSD